MNRISEQTFMVFSDQTSSVKSLEFINDRTHFISGYQDGSVSLFSLKSAMAIKKFSLGSQPIDLIRVSYNMQGLKALVGNLETSFLILLDLSADEEIKLNKTYQGTNSRISFVNLSAVGEQIYVVTEDFKLMIYDINNENIKLRQSLTGISASEICFSFDNKHVIVLSQYKVLNRKKSMLFF